MKFKIGDIVVNSTDKWATTEFAIEGKYLDASSKEDPTIELRFLKANKELKDELIRYLTGDKTDGAEHIKNRNPGFMKLMRGVRDIMIDICESAEEAELEDTVIKERVKNATNKKR